MNRPLHRIILVCAILLIATTSWLQGTALAGDSMGACGTTTAGTILGVRNQLDALRTEYADLGYQVSATQEKVRVAKAKVDDGLATNADLGAANLELHQAITRLDQCESKMKQTGRLVKLADPVDLTLKSAGIRQVAETLSRVSGLSIAVDPKVPVNILVSTTAQGVPLGGVLETIAISANLTIFPSDSGVLLKPSGVLQTDEHSFVVRSDNWPWSDDWGVVGTGGLLGRRWLRLFECGPAPAAQASSAPAACSAQSLALAGVGPNTLVVSEPATGPQGEPGYWLTLYQLKSGKLIPGSRSFYRSMNVRQIVPQSTSTVSKPKTQAARKGATTKVRSR